MTVSLKRRNKAAHSTSSDTVTQNKTETNTVNKSTSKSKQNDREKNNSNIHERHRGTTSPIWSVLWALNVVLGVGAIVAAGGLHAWYMYQLHENQLWFSHIQEIEREISFRTESGLYYSFYKYLVNSPDFLQDIQSLTVNESTQHPEAINILARMNIYQEVILATLYRQFGISLQPIFFYIYSIFCLNGLLVSALCLLTWLLSKSWMAGILSAAFYMFNRLDTTRVDSSVPLRENFALPFLWIQAAGIAMYFKPRVRGILESCCQMIIFLSTLLFCCFWQFSQFIMLLQGFSLFAVWVLGLVPTVKVIFVMVCQLTALTCVCTLQFLNPMILTSLAVSFIFSSLCWISFLREVGRQQTILRDIIVVIGVSAVPLILMIVLSTIMKLIVKDDSGDHIVSFIENKFGLGNVRDFDARMYLCLDIFGFMKRDIFDRLTSNFVFPFYVIAHAVMLACLVSTVTNKWIRLNKGKEERETRTSGTDCLLNRPELTFHIVQSVFFAAVAITTMRMKYLWTPYMCVLAAVGIADKITWTQILKVFRVNSKFVVGIARVSAALLVLAIMLKILLPPVLEELKVETEFWDPDTVELMSWIKRNTSEGAVFTGSMQLMAGVKLCTGRHITNHPHYEDSFLRHKTKQLYQIYGRTTVQDVYNILTKYDTKYIIIEDSICYAPSQDGCRLPDIVDISNGMMPDAPVNIKGLIISRIPRFCDKIRNLTQEDSRFFQLVFVNKTFRVYRLKGI